MILFYNYFGIDNDHTQYLKENYLLVFTLTHFPQIFIPNISMLLPRFQQKMSDRLLRLRALMCKTSIISQMKEYSLSKTKKIKLEWRQTPTKIQFGYLRCINHGEMKINKNMQI